MKIVSLVENTSRSGEYKTEHGLSLYIETQRHKLLFDMGQTDIFAENAKKLGVALKEIDIGVLSHGHYDHGGGLGKFLEINQKASVYISRYAFCPHYNGTEKYIGLDKTLKDSKRLIFTGEKCEIDNGLTLYSYNDRIKKHELGSSGLTVMENDKFRPDDFRHEQYLLIEEDGRRVLISGCSHKGILDIADWFKPDILVGGFHFSKLPPDDKLRGYAEYLNGFDTQFYTCHCTGCEQYEFMRKYMDNLNYISTGDCIEF